MAARSVLDDNKRLVTEFYELAINQRKPAEAVRKYIEFQATSWFPVAFPPAS